MQTLRVLCGPVNLRASRRAVLAVALGLALLGHLAAPQFLPSGFAPASVQAASPALAALGWPRVDGFHQLVANTTASKTLGKMPLNFTRNEGQTDARVNFTARGRGYSLFLTPTEAVMALRQADSLDTAALRMQLLHANPHASNAGLDQLSTVSNYYLGNNPKQFRENVAHYAKVKYAQVYPGIDVVYYGNQGQLEYDFVVAPGADPNAIQMKFAGATNLRIADNGDLVIGLKGGELRHHKPVVYQTINGTRREVAGQFVINQHNEVGFVLGAYDTTKELVIDPTLAYSTYLGGYEGDEKAYAVAITPGCTGTCASFITGEVASLTFPDTNLGSSSGGKDVFVARMNAAGTGVDYFTFIGGSGDEHGRGIKADSAGRVYVVGIMGSNFDATGTATGLTTADPVPNNEDAFIARLNINGGLLNFTYLAGSGFDQANAVALNDLNTNVCVTGQTYSSNFPTTAGVHDATYNGGNDVFVSRLTANLGALNYSTYIGGGNMDYGNGIDVYSGIIYVTGNTQSSNFPTTTNAWDRTITGFAPVDAFVAKLDPALPTATELTYSTYLGGNGREYAYGISVDKSNGEWAIAGRSHSPGASTAGYAGTSNGFPVSSSGFQTTQAGLGDVFVTRFNAVGGIGYSTLLGGTDYDVAYAIELRGAEVFVVGETDSTNFPLVNQFQGDQPGTDAFVLRLNCAAPGALGLLFSTYFGGGYLDSSFAVDSARGIAIAPVVTGTEIYVAGFTNANSTASGGTFPIVPAIPYQEDLAGGADGATDCFVTRIAP